MLAENVHPFEELVPSCAEKRGITVSPVGGRADRVPCSPPDAHHSVLSRLTVSPAMGQVCQLWPACESAYRPHTQQSCPDRQESRPAPAAGRPPPEGETTLTHMTGSCPSSPRGQLATCLEGRSPNPQPGRTPDQRAEGIREYRREAVLAEKPRPWEEQRVSTNSLFG